MALTRYALARHSLLAVLCLLPASTLFAQPDELVAHLLYEPVPEAGMEPTRPLLSFNDAGNLLPPPAATQRQLSRAEREDSEAAIAAYLARIGDSEADAGPYSDALREDLFNTGLLYQKLNDHESALKLMERALAVSRINHGLEGLDQVPIMEAMAQSYLARERITDADAMMSAAFTLQQNVYGRGSPELVPALTTLGDWNTQAFLDRSSILVNVQRMDVNRFLQDPRSFIEPLRDVRSSPEFNLVSATESYRDAIVALVDAQQFTHPSLLTLERKLVTNYFLLTHRENILYEPDFYLTRIKEKTASRVNHNAAELLKSESYLLGREAHKRIIAYIYNDQSATPTQLARALLEEADWDVLYERKTLAVEKYDALYRLFHANPELGSQVQDLLYPSVPVVLPTFMPAPNSREKLGIAADAAVNFFGYIDVAFSINKQGKARRIRVLGTGGEVTRNMEIRMQQYLQHVQFRPRFDGAELDTGQIRLRYYIGI